MSTHRIEIRVKPRHGLLNPEGKAIHHALVSLGWSGVEDVRVGKVLYVDLEAPSAEEAVQAADAMCRKLLANPVTEDYEVSVTGDQEVVVS